MRKKYVGGVYDGPAQGLSQWGGRLDITIIALFENTEKYTGYLRRTGARPVPTAYVRWHIITAVFENTKKHAGAFTTDRRAARSRDVRDAPPVSFVIKK